MARMKTTTGMVLVKYTTIPVCAANADFKTPGRTQVDRLTSGKDGASAFASSGLPPLTDPSARFIGTMICFYQCQRRQKVT